MDCSNPSLANLDVCKSGEPQENCPKLGCSKKLMWSGCSNCSDSTDNAKCNECSAGRVMKNGVCVGCGVDECCPAGSTSPVAFNCHFCSADQGECTTCREEYEVVNGTCALIPKSSSSYQNPNEKISAAVGAAVGVVCFVVVAAVAAFVVVVVKKRSSGAQAEDGVELEAM